MMNINRRNFSKSLIGGALLSSFSFASAQNEFPARDVRIVVPYAAGGTTDQLARTIGKYMERHFGRNVIVENKPGAGGIIGEEAVVNSKADGYNLVFGNSGPNATSSLIREMPYDVINDFTPVSGSIRSPLILSVPESAPYNTLEEFIEVAVNQKKDLSAGSTGVGGASHLTVELFNNLSGANLVHIPYKGGAPTVTALASGEIDVAFLTGLDGITMKEAGKIKYLGSCDVTESQVLPGLEPINKFIPGFQSVVWFGLLGPAKLPSNILSSLEAAAIQAVKQPDFRKWLIERNVDPWGSTSEELGQTIASELELWGPVVKEANIRI